MRMVACDLDGTIVRADGTISARTVAALAACEQVGVRVVFVTGRPPRWMPPVAEATGHRGLAVCGNGALVVDLADGGVVRATGLEPEAVLEVAARLRPVLPGAAFALETLTGYRREPEFAPHHVAAREALAGELPDLLADRPLVIKVLCRQEERPSAALGPGDRLPADDMLRLARQVLDGVAEPVHSNPLGGLLEISAHGVSKSSALARLAEEWGVPAADVVAFGDMPNDVPMLRWAGRGYAMSGGHPEAVRAAGAVAPPCEEDGVAQVLEALLAEKAGYRPADVAAEIPEDRPAGRYHPG